MKTIALTFVVAGALLAAAGYFAMNAASSDFSRFLRDAPPNRMPWVILIGAALFAGGVIATWRTFSKDRTEAA